MSSEAPDPFANSAVAIRAPLHSNGPRRIQDLKIGRAIEGLPFPSVPGAVIQTGADFEWAWRVFLSRRTEADRHGVIREMDRKEVCAVGRRQAA